MSKTNCCNCGAPLDIFSPKCEFCGTKNINMTDIDLASGEAANFIFRMPHTIVGEDGGELYMSMLAVPELDAVEMTTNPVSVYGGFSKTPLVTYDTGPELTMSLNLRAVKNIKGKEICKIVKYAGDN